MTAGETHPLLQMVLTSWDRHMSDGERDPPATADGTDIAAYGVNSDVNTAPFKLGSTAEIFNTFRLPLSIQTVCLSASLSAATISNLYASNVTKVVPRFKF